MMLPASETLHEDAASRALSDPAYTTNIQTFPDSLQKKKNNFKKKRV